MSTPVVDPVEDTSVVERVAGLIRRSIIDGRLRPGEPFSTSELRDQLGVSIIPVREALRRLEEQGLVEIRHRRSAIVAPISEKDLLDIYRLRTMIEPELAALGTPKLTPDDLERLDTLLERMRESPESEEFWERHHAFHRSFLDLDGSPWSERITEMLWRATERYHRLLVMHDLQARDPDGMYKQHAPIVAAARRGDAHGVRLAWAGHLEAGRDAMVKALRAMAQAGG